ncbi:hypothetical protein KSS87_002264 [Heliosperma pusillum]|nr:hypothetical protein KSS87_002264 [Heliosperma pusillum]
MDGTANQARPTWLAYKVDLDNVFSKIYEGPTHAHLLHSRMETQSCVKVSIRLGSDEVYTVNGSTSGILSDQLVSMKQESIIILKDYITRHNAPADVPDEPLEASSGDEDDVLLKPKSKKRK